MKHPMQKMHKDGKIIRFVANQIIKDLYEQGKIDLNAIAANPAYSNDDRAQLSQLIGYSVSGYCDLSHPTEKNKDKAWARMEKLAHKLDTDESEV